MAIYSLHVSNVSRAAGSSAVASCSYITSRRMRDERTGEAFNGFGRRERVEHVCTMLPEGAPGEYLDPERLFNAVEMAEKRSDARPAKKIMVALPREFDARERFRALEDFISWNITANGYACTYAIHTDKDGRNPHAHILVANRRIDPKTGRWAAKSRSEFALDANGRRIPVIDPDTGRQKIGARNRKVWKRVNVSNNPLDSKEFLERLRREWADSCNALLPGYAVIDHRSFKARGIERIPTIHEGYAARAIERAGGVSERCQTNREIRRSNSLLTAVRAELGRIFDRLGELFAAKIGRLRRRQARPEPAREPNWRYFEGDARRQLEADRADHTAAIRGKLMGAKADVRNREEWWRSHGTEEFEAAKQIIDVARAASREARDAHVFKRGRLLRNAEQVAGEQSERLRGAVPWLEDADIPADWDQANRFRMRTTKAIYDHDMQPRTRLVAELERRLEQAERAESERPSPEQVKALALRMAEQRAQAENPTQDTKRPAPSGDEPLDLSEPEDWGEASPFESRQAPRTKADLLNEIRQRTDRLTGQREAEQRQIDPWSAQPPQRRGHGR